MVVHVVLLKPRGDISEADRADLLNALAVARREIPSIRRFVGGPRVRHGRAYELQMVEDYAYAAIVEFDDAAGLRAYLEHPAHARLGELFGTLFSGSLAYDYEVDEVDKLPFVG